MPGSREQQQAVATSPSLSAWWSTCRGEIAREAASYVALETLAGGLMGSITEIAVLAAEHLHPASLALRGAVAALEARDDIGKRV